MKTEAKEPAVMKLWLLRPKDRNEPPFHFAGVPQVLVVAAPDANRARALAAHEPGGDAWLKEPDLASCEELRPETAGVIARDMG